MRGRLFADARLLGYQLRKLLDVSDNAGARSIQMKTFDANRSRAIPITVRRVADHGYLGRIFKEGGQALPERTAEKQG